MPRTKVEYRSAQKSTYDKFCKENSDIVISFKDWEKIIYTYNHLLRDYILDTGEKVKLPCGLGALAISSKKTKKYLNHRGVERVNLHVDWKKSRGTGKRIYHLNNHTDGRNFKWLWFPEDANFYQSSVWSFKPCRVASRKITEYIEKDTKRCLEIYKQWV